MEGSGGREAGAGVLKKIKDKWSAILTIFLVSTTFSTPIKFVTLKRWKIESLKEKKEWEF